MRASSNIQITPRRANRSRVWIWTDAFSSGMMQLSLMARRVSRVRAQPFRRSFFGRSSHSWAWLPSGGTPLLVAFAAYSLLAFEAGCVRIAGGSDPVLTRLVAEDNVEGYRKGLAICMSLTDPVLHGCTDDFRRRRSAHQRPAIQSTIQQM